MASLRSMILDGRVPPPPDTLEGRTYAHFFSLTQDALRSHDTILVNITPVAHDLGEGLKRTPQGGIPDDPSFADRHLIPVPKPPHRVMWLEAAYPGVRVGHLVRRTEIGDSDAEAFVKNSPWIYPAETAKAINMVERPTVVEVCLWSGSQGQIDAEGNFIYWLNANGDWQNSRYRQFPPHPDSFNAAEDLRKEEFQWIRLNYQFISIAEYVVLHTFARLNCHNVVLVPVAGGGPRRKKDADHPPYSIWHEIKVTGLPQLRREQVGEILPDGEKQEMRFHEVRGHYADYTKGKGLFGRWKVRIWIEEHAVGNPDLGTVKTSYKVE